MSNPDAPHDRDEPRPDGAARFAALPPRVAFEDMVEEKPASTPVPDTTPDPNREVAWRYGMLGGI